MVIQSYYNQLACGASKLASTATIGEVKKYIRQLIEEKKKKIRKPEVVSPVYVDRILAELEILQMVMAEIYDIGRRKELAREYEQRKKSKQLIGIENNPKS
jgi:hypothetical protein